MRSILVIDLINKDLRDIYESTEKVGLKSFEDRMRKAFSRPQKLIWREHLIETDKGRWNGGSDQTE